MVAVLGILIYWPGLEISREWGGCELVRRSGEHNELVLRVGKWGIYLDRFSDPKESYLPIGYGKRKDMAFVRRKHWELQFFWNG